MLVCCSEDMERYLLCGEILSVPQSRAVYKGRKRGTVEFYAIHKHDKAAKPHSSKTYRFGHTNHTVHVVTMVTDKLRKQWYERFTIKV